MYLLVGIFGLVVSKINHGPTYGFLQAWLIIVIGVYVINLCFSFVFQGLTATENVDDLIGWNESAHKAFIPAEAFEVACNCTKLHIRREGSDCSGMITVQ